MFLKILNIYLVLKIFQKVRIVMLRWNILQYLTKILRQYFNYDEILEIFLTCFCNILCYVGGKGPAWIHFNWTRTDWTRIIGHSRIGLQINWTEYVWISNQLETVGLDICRLMSVKCAIQPSEYIGTGYMANWVPYGKKKYW